MILQIRIMAILGPGSGAAYVTRMIGSNSLQRISPCSCQHESYLEISINVQTNGIAIAPDATPQAHV